MPPPRPRHCSPFQDIADRFAPFPAFDEYAQVESESRDVDADVALAIPEHDGQTAARAATDAIAFANWPRWEDHVSGAKTRSA
jgi:hypothetical protein